MVAGARPATPGAGVVPNFGKGMEFGIMHFTNPALALSADAADFADKLGIESASIGEICGQTCQRHDSGFLGLVLRLGTTPAPGVAGRAPASSP